MAFCDITKPSPSQVAAFFVRPKQNYKIAQDRSASLDIAQHRSAPFAIFSNATNSQNRIANAVSGCIVSFVAGKFKQITPAYNSFGELLMSTKVEHKTGLAAKGEAAKYLGVSRPTLERLIRRGDVETRCTGSHKKVTWHSVYVYLGEIESNSQGEE